MVSKIYGGTHVDGLRLALSKVINDAGKKLNILKESDRLSGEDVREGRAVQLFHKLFDAALVQKRVVLFFAFALARRGNFSKRSRLQTDL